MQSMINWGVIEVLAGIFFVILAWRYFPRTLSFIFSLMLLVCYGEKIKPVENTAIALALWIFSWLAPIASLGIDLSQLPKKEKENKTE
jgi:hypothetical protein